MLLPFSSLLCLWLCGEAAASQLHWSKTQTTFSPHHESTAAERSSQSRRWRAVTGEDNGGTRGASAQSSWLDSVDPASSDPLGTEMPRRAVRKSDAPNGARRIRQLPADEALRTDVNKAGSSGCRPGDALKRSPRGRTFRPGRERRRRKRSEPPQDGAAMAQEQEAGPPFGLNNASDYEEEYSLPDFPDATPLAPLNPRTRRKQLKNPFYPVTAESVGAYAVVLAAAVLFGVGVIGNVSVMCIVCHNYYMRSISNSLLANLAQRDFVIIFFCLPLVVFRELTKDWLLGDFSCRIIPYLEDVVVASGFTVGRSPTVHKDKLHPFNLLMRGDDACVYVSRPPPPPDPGSPPADKRSSALPPQVSKATTAPKYTYSGLNELKVGSVVNAYGVVLFFKQPFKSRGTDFCSTLKITDQSNQRICCSIFGEKLKDHPKVFQVGDIVRLHRFKAQFFNNSMTLVNSYGFSVLVFDGAEGGSMEPRTSSHSFHLDQEDRRTVEELRSWAASQDLLPPTLTTPLSAAQPKTYFDLTCQLLAKAPISSTCTLLRVWDGTRCAHTLLKVVVEPSITEGPASFSRSRESLVANVLVYDNHVEVTRQLKPGDFLRIYNLRAIPGSSKLPGLTSSQQQEAAELDHLAFHLHGGTAYGRGIRVLPETSPDVQDMKRAMEAVPDEDDFSDLNDSQLLEVWSTPPESPDAEPMECITDRSCGHDTRPVTLSELKRSDPGRVHRVRVQLSDYEPRRLHQALKLYCSKCTSMRDVPDDELVAGLFSEASRGRGPCSPPPWVLSGWVAVPGRSPASPRRVLDVHVSEELLGGKPKELLFLAGSTLEETRRLAAGYQNIVPVRSSGGHMALLDLEAPFLFRGRKRYFGCKRCSEAAMREPSCAKGVESIDEEVLAEALGVQRLQFVLLMKLELQDATDTLDVFLWRDAESFFGVSAEDVAANQEAQNSVRRTMDVLCPAGGSTGERPWMDLCLVAYRAEDEAGRNQTFYQICHSTVTTPASMHSNAP